MKSICLLFIFFAVAGLPGISSAANAGPDSTAQTPANWDPADPNCPCHKLQQQAEDEYLRMQQANAPDNAADTTLIAVPADHVMASGSANAHSTVSSNGKSARQVSRANQKMLHKSMRKLGRCLGCRKNGTKRKKFRIAGCFEF